MPCVSGKEYVGIVRLHNALENEHQLARVSVRKRDGMDVLVVFFSHAVK